MSRVVENAARRFTSKALDATEAEVYAAAVIGTAIVEAARVIKADQPLLPEDIRQGIHLEHYLIQCLRRLSEANRIRGIGHSRQGIEVTFNDGSEARFRVRIRGHADLAVSDPDEADRVAEEFGALVEEGEHEGFDEPPPATPPSEEDGD